jgi:hypothetical protein
MSASPPDHEDKEAIPHVLEVIKSLGKDSEPGVVTAKQKVELWKYNSNLVFKPGEAVVCLFLLCNMHGLTLMPRIWTFWMRLELLCIPEGFFVSLKLDSNGTVGVNSLFFCSIIIVSHDRAGWFYSSHVVNQWL